MLDPVDVSYSKVCQGSLPCGMKKRYICGDLEPATSSFCLARSISGIQGIVLCFSETLMGERKP